MSTPNRNDPCPCGSGKKYKQCCLKRDEALAADKRAETASIPKALKEAIAHHQAGRLPQAEALYQQILQVDPNHPDALHFLGVIALQMKKNEVAVELISKALAVKPDLAEAHNNLGLVLKDQGLLDAAVEHCRKAIALKPDFAEAHNNLGIALKDQGKLDEAIKHYQKALSIKPDYPLALSNLGFALQAQGLLNEAVKHYLKALAIKPDLAEAHINLGGALQNQGKPDEAIEHCLKALSIKPDYAEAHNNLGNALLDQGRLGEAAEHFRKALAIKPNYAEAHNNLGNVLRDQGLLDEAAEHSRKALAIKPAYSEAHSNLLFCLSHNEGLSAQELFAEHVRFGEQFEAPLRAHWPQHTNSRDPERRLQIGFVSGDLRFHAVANFIEPVLAHLSGYPQLSLHAYANHAADDSTTRRLREHFAHWYPVTGLPDAALAQKIRDDGIDILIDLSGHTAQNRLLAFARKPAPVQASWMGYPGTTGLRAMDYYLADRFLLPPGQFDDQFMEKIVRLPASAPFLPAEGAPPVNALPALDNGHVTFGSFNRLNKLSPPVIALWSQLLRALPDSKMLLAGLPEDGRYDTLIEWFAREGIARERLSFHGRCGMDAYLSLHRQVDICLDTFPYNGGTTTCHALWMGIPTLTLAGDTMPGRVGATVLGHVGLDGFVAHDAADFVHKGLSWAGNLAALSDIRAGLRERFANSAMGQPAVVAAGVERALRIMWRRWCAGLPPESFEISLQT